MDSLKYLKSIIPIRTLSRSQRAEKTSVHCIINIVAESVTQQEPAHCWTHTEADMMPTSEKRKRVYLAVYRPGDRSQGSGLSLRPGLGGCEGLSTGLPGQWTSLLTASAGQVLTAAWSCGGEHVRVHRCRL